MRRHPAELCDDFFDLLVAGGGALGAFVAREAARAGLRAALLERSDFAAGASGASQKIVHGGLRQLLRGDLAGLRRSSEARAEWLRLAPHLVEPLPVVAVGPRGSGPASGVLSLAGRLGDAVDRRRNADLPPGRELPPTRGLGAGELRKVTGGLAGRGSRAGLLFHDALMYSPERLVLEAVESAVGQGCVAVNHAEVVLADGGPVVEPPDGIAVLDRVGGERFEVRARILVDATGASVPGTPRLLAFGLVLPDLGLEAALAVTTPAARSGAAPGRGRRRLLLVPWRGRTLAGTAHVPEAAVGSTGAPGGGDEPAVPPADAVDAFVAELRDALPALEIGPGDVLAAPAAWLPLAVGTDGLLDEPTLDVDEGGAVTRVTARTEKLTTAPLLARTVVERVLALLGRARDASRAPEPLPGGRGWHPALATDVREGTDPPLPADVAEHLARVYGTRWRRVADRIEVGPGPGRVVEGSPVIEAQLRLAVDEEMALTVDDLLRRRTELGQTGLADAPAREAARRALARREASRRLPTESA